MPRADFTQAAVKRAVLAVEATGKTVRGVEVRRDGSILVLVDTGAAGADTAAVQTGGNTCDEAFGCAG
jgi:glucose/arabinose dehydrogenase